MIDTAVENLIPLRDVPRRLPHRQAECVVREPEPPEAWERLAVGRTMFRVLDTTIPLDRRGNPPERLSTIEPAGILIRDHAAAPKLEERGVLRVVRIGDDEEEASPDESGERGDHVGVREHLAREPVGLRAAQRQVPPDDERQTEHYAPCVDRDDANPGERQAEEDRVHAHVIATCGFARQAA